MSAENDLWISLLKISAASKGIDISHVPECVLEHYADKDLTVRQALAEIES